MEVLNEPGPGLIEKAYENALVIEFQLRETALVAFESGVDEHRVLVRVANHLLDDAVPPVRVGVGDAEAEGVVRQTLQLRCEVAFLLVKECLAIGDQIL
jgi:hypothetical protein